MKLVNKSALSAVVAMSATAVLFGQVATTTPSTASVALAANTLLVMGGNGNPDGVNMEKELNGLISGKEGTPYAGYDFKTVRWSAQTPISTGADGTLFNVSQAEGLEKINAALAANPPSTASKVVIVGYSSSASVVSKQINQLQAKRNNGGEASTPSPDDLSFVVFGNPTRPNGGFFSRYPGYKIGPPLGVDFQEPLAPTDYKVTDVCRQYDGFCDYPTNPTNMLVMINTALGMYFDHGDYFNVDITNKDNILRDETTADGTRFITVKNTLPILRFMPSFLAAPLDAFLRPQIEAAYDRKSSLGTPTPSTVSAANDPLLNLVNTYLRLFGGSGSGTQTPVESKTTNTLVSARKSSTAASAPADTTSVEPSTTAPSTAPTSTSTAPTGEAMTSSSTAPSSTTPSSTVSSPALTDSTTPSTDTTPSTPAKSDTPTTPAAA